MVPWGGGTHIWKWYICAAQSLKIGGRVLKSGPSLNQTFFKLDLRCGYWHVEIEEEDKHLTAFTAGNMGFFESTRMAFGLTNAPATFEGLIERCMGESLTSKNIPYFSTTYWSFPKRSRNSWNAWKQFSVN